MRPAGLLPLLLALALRSPAQGLPVPPLAIASNSSTGYVLIRNASHVQTFSNLIMHFTTQARAWAARNRLWGLRRWDGARSRTRCTAAWPRPPWC